MKNISIFFYILILFTSISCNDGKKTQNVVDSLEGNDSLALNSEKVNLLENNDSLIWFNNSIKIYADHNIIEQGEEELTIHTGKEDALLKFIHEDGGRITFPFIVEKGDNVFVVFFEVWEGSGFLSKKHLYYLDAQSYTLDKVEQIGSKELLSIAKSKFKIKDSIYSKKGFFYKNYEFGKDCFDKQNNLPFSLLLFNHDHSDLNNGLEGYKVLKGEFVFNKTSKGFVLEPEKLRLIDVKQQ